MEALDVGGGELFRGIGRGGADAHLEGTESVEDHALDVLCAHRQGERAQQEYDG